MRLLVAPVAMARPILLEETDWPRAPRIPEAMFLGSAGKHAPANGSHLDSLPISVIDLLTGGQITHGLERGR